MECHRALIQHKVYTQRATASADVELHLLRKKEVMKKITSHSVILLLILSSTFFTTIHGNYTMPTPLHSDQFLFLDEAEFFEANQTVAIINITRAPEKSVLGVAYYRTPIRMKDPTTNRAASFNTSFTFHEEPMTYSPWNSSARSMKGDGFTFVLSGSKIWKGNPAGRFGIFSSNPQVDDPKVVAIEFDSWKNDDTDPGLQQAEHVGLDAGSPISDLSCFAYVFNTTGIHFWHRDVLHAWIEYDGMTGILQVRLANTSVRPLNPLVNCSHDLYDAFEEKMWVGFSGSHGDAWSIYYIYNWSFTSYGIASEFPPSPKAHVHVKVGVIASVCGGILLVVLVGMVLVGVCAHRRRKRGQTEKWDTEGMVEMAGMPGFITYKHLSAATKQFSDQSKLGQGGFGSVYRGVLPKTGTQVAVKKVSNNSRQGEREFLAEVQIISQLRHRNVVELIGFCRDRGKFLLVYELLPKGSLDQALFKPKTTGDVISWSTRWKIVSGTAAALHYLHEGWRQQVIHRDVKSSNIMLDEEYNPKLGDFGLARLVDHEKYAATTMVAGTPGYIAPEAAGGKFTDKTDVFAFGAVALEVVSGRRAYDPTLKSDDYILVEMVWRHLKEEDLLNSADPLLLGSYDGEQMEKVLKLGLLCSHPDPGSRPSMRQVVQVLAGVAEVPEVPESMPIAKLSADLPRLSINDLMSSDSGSQYSRSGGIRPVSSVPPSVSPCSNAAVSVTQLFPR